MKYIKKKSHFQPKWIFFPKNLDPLTKEDNDI